MAALHNFIHLHNPQANTSTHPTGNNSNHAPGGFYAGDDSLIPTGTGMDVEEEQNLSEASIQQNKIADDMWRQYQEVLYQRSLAGMADEKSEDDEEGDDLEESDNNFYI